MSYLTINDDVIVTKIYSLEKQIEEKDKEIERLKEENDFLKLNNPEMNIEHFRVVKENKRKIEDLRKELKQAKEIALNDHKYASEMEDKYITANNIINELEDYLNEQVDYMKHHSIERMVAFDCCRHKLQELKDSDN